MVISYSPRVGLSQARGGMDLHTNGAPSQVTLPLDRCVESGGMGGLRERQAT